MKVQLYLKNSTFPHTYEFSFEEFQRLSRDFEKFLQTGLPKIGTYNHIVEKTRDKKPLFVAFEAISLIG